jgi:hypothetical protein
MTINTLENGPSVGLPEIHLLQETCLCFRLTLLKLLKMAGWGNHLGF